MDLKKIFLFIKSKSTNKNLFLFCITAFPGLNKLATLFFVNLLFTIEKTGDFVNDTFIMYIFGYFTVFNWTNFILSEMPKLPLKKQPIFFGKISWLSIITNIPIIIIAVIIGRFGIIVEVPGFICYLIGWSFHQLWRHYYISTKEYRFLFFSDILIFLSGILCLLVSQKIGGVLLLQTIPCVVIPIMYKIFNWGSPQFYFDFKFKSKFNSRIFKRSFNYSLINLSTGGIQLIFAPLSHHLLSSQYTTALGFANNVASIALLIPRSIAYKYIPMLTADYRNSINTFNERLIRFQKEINLLVLILFLGGIIFILTAALLNQKIDYSIITLTILVYANLLVSQYSLPISNALIIRKVNTILMNANIKFFILYIFLLTLILSISLDGYFTVLLCLIFSLVLNQFRFINLKKIYSEQFDLKKKN